MNILHKVASILVLCLLYAASANATGPRVTTALFTGNENAVHTVDFPPYVSSEVLDGGVASEIVHTAFKRANISADITIHPLRNMVRYYLLQENAMGIIARHLNDVSEVRKELIEVPIMQIKESYFYYQPHHTQGLPWSKDLKQLKGLTYGAHQGEDTSAFENAGIQIVAGRTMSLINKLISGEVDFLKAPSLTLEWLLKKYMPNEAKNIGSAEAGEQVDTLVVAFNRRHASGLVAVKKFKGALADMKKDGTYDNIISRHLSTSSEGKLYLRPLHSLSNGHHK